MIAAARCPARNDPANGQFERPSAIGRIWFSTQLLSGGNAPSSHDRGQVLQSRILPTPSPTDAAGNATRVGSLNPIVHDDRGRMVSVTSSAGTTTYAYNGLGERVRKTGPVSAIPTGTHHFVYAEDGKLLGEYDANGAVILEHVYAEDVPVFVMRGAKTFHVHTDHLNTPREIYDMAWDGTGLVWDWGNGDPFGEIPPQELTDAEGVAFRYNPRYPGQYYDRETGLQYNYFRDYDPGSGRYVQADPIGPEGWTNLYAYVGGNPHSQVDPIGLAIVDVSQYGDGPSGSVMSREVGEFHYVCDQISGWGSKKTSLPRGNCRTLSFAMRLHLPPTPRSASCAN